MTHKTQKLRIYPTKSQALQLEKQFGANRWLWNYLLAEQIKRYSQGEKHLTSFGMCYLITPLKIEEDTKWLKEVANNSLQRVTKNLADAYTTFFKTKIGFPKFKSQRKAKPSAIFSNDLKVSYNSNGTGKLQVPKVKGIKFRSGYTDPHSNSLKTITITKDKLGNYYASLCFKVADKPKPLPYNEDNTIGIDLGVKTFAVLSNGNAIEKPKNVEALAPKIKEQQVKLSKTQKGSNRRKKSILRLNKLHIIQSNRRLDWLHKTTRQLVDDNQVNCYAVEDLSVAGMLHDSPSSLASKIQDSCFRMFRILLGQKLEAVGKTLGEIHRYEPSSKTCGDCGHVHKELTLAQRSWTCPSCGVIHDRDLNAANNIKKMYLSGSSKLNRLQKPSGGRLGSLESEDMIKAGKTDNKVSTLTKKG
jgi:putative transposase